MTSPLDTPVDQGATPRPWCVGHSMERNYLYGDGAHIACISSRENGFPIYDDGSLNESEANAALIVKAVNSHDALVEALRAARDFLPFNLPKEDAVELHAGLYVAWQKIDAAFAALSKSEGV